MSRTKKLPDPNATTKLPLPPSIGSPAQLPVTGETRRLTPGMAKAGIVVPPLPAVIEQGYVWHSAENERKFREHFEAYTISAQLGLEQVKVHHWEIVECLNFDMAQKLSYLATMQSGYQGFYTYMFCDGIRLNQQYWTADKYPGNRYWRLYDPIEFKRGQIPIHVLRMFHWARVYEPAPDAFWILVEEPPRSIDPPIKNPIMLLCANYGQWVVWFAEWQVR